MSDTTPIEPGRQPADPPTVAMGAHPRAERYEPPSLRDSSSGHYPPDAYRPGGGQAGDDRAGEHQAGGYQSAGYQSAGYPSGQQPGGYPAPMPGPYPDAGQPGLYGPPPRKTNTYAIVSLVCSLAGVFTGVSVIAGIVLGHLALNQIKQTGEEGRGFAIAGLAVGYGLLAIGLLLVVVAVFAFAVIIPWTTTTGPTSF